MEAQMGYRRRSLEAIPPLRSVNASSFPLNQAAPADAHSSASGMSGCD